MLHVELCHTPFRYSTRHWGTPPPHWVTSDLAEIRHTPQRYATPHWDMHTPLRYAKPHLSFATPHWAMPHPTELCQTLLSYTTTPGLSYAIWLWATSTHHLATPYPLSYANVRSHRGMPQLPHPTGIRHIPLRYATPQEAQSQPNRLRHTSGVLINVRLGESLH